MCAGKAHGCMERQHFWTRNMVRWQAKEFCTECRFRFRIASLHPSPAAKRKYALEMCSRLLRRSFQ
jgi:hypothetical protein